MVNKRQAIKNGVSGVYLAIILLLIYAPILLLLFASFSSARIIGEGGTFSFEWYIKLFQSERVMGILLNTVLLAVIAATLSTVVGTMGAIGIFYSNKRTSALLQGANQIPVVNAEIVTALALAILFAAVTLQRTYFSLVVGHLVLCTPFVLISVIPKLKQMDNNLYEAALDLGATPTKALFSVVIPQIMPGILSGFMLAVTLSLDDYVIAAYTKPNTFQTISTHIYSLAKGGTVNTIKSSYWAFTAVIFLVIIIAVIVMNVVAHKKVGKKQ